ncbi:D-amino-acid:oxygen oxidoreductase (deaminating) [Murinocardiopsis flavida]|uniref:D-amino-acid oxidase n=2 Tax=Murinocardiopsis flavida TaxID=645275 RepID=A0A2P8CJ66_9ACTN|nr:D-amino-acid:oxygen oxidoreductase (deaminating) [Murinocardiopsis flavida]
MVDMGRSGALPDTSVIVVGCGVVGLTTAITLQEAGFAVRIWSAEPPADTTSIIAGATWFPYKAYPLDRVLEWARVSKPVFVEMAADPATGVAVRDCLHLYRDPVDLVPWWASTVPDLRRVPEAELPDGFRDSYFFTQPVIDMPIYLDYLLDRFRAGGGEVHLREVTSLAEPAEAAAIVVNCTGLRARELAGDTGVVPVRGQWVRVENPGIDRCIADFDHPGGVTYVIPRLGSLLLGGTGDENAWDTEPDPRVAEEIVARCAELDPRLAHARVLEHRAGLRPVRPAGVRLEEEALPGGGVCVHNYGHGGAGVTLSWGCAAEAARLVGAAADRGGR